MIQRRGLTAGFIALCLAVSFGAVRADETASVKNHTGDLCESSGSGGEKRCQRHDDTPCARL